MSDPEVQSVAATGGTGLSQLQRISNMFLEPSKTFEDIKLGNKSWWLPFLLFVLVGTGLWATVTVKVGWDQVVVNSMQMNPKQAAQLDRLTPEQQATQKRIATIAQTWIWALAPAGVLLLNLIAAGILLATINFGFGGRATFGKVLAVSWYAGLPGLVKLALGTAGLWAGLTPESFLPQNPAGTNLGFYLTPPDVSTVLWSLCSALDILTIWTLVLFSIGLAKVAGTKTSTGFYAVFGWWVLSLLVGVGMAAIAS
ncbi:MAG: YIP1 family protein [Terracidiphilus sp.]|nr:YIP1 family protein [Terracidiphilus sp.]